MAVGAEEPCWVERAKVDTVRRLEAAVRGGPEHAEEDWHRLRVGLPPGEAEIVEVALEVAGILTGPAAPLWKRIEAIAMEFLGAHPVDPRERFVPRPPPSPPAGWGPPARALPPAVARAAPPPDVACGTDQPAAAFLPEAGNEGAASSGAPRGPAPSPDVARAAPPPDVACAAPSPDVASGPEEPRDPYEILARLTRLVHERAGQDELLGRACLLVRRFGTWRRAGFVCFDEWCAEWLGLAPSTVRQRIALERRMQQLPELREALRSRLLSYEQARLVARVARASDVAARIEEAAARTAIAYRRELEGEEHHQMWRAGELRAVVPDEVDDLLADAIRAARACSRGGLTPGEALVLVALHFIFTWKDEVNRLVKAADRVILRDGGLCQVPGCSRPADHVHHVRYRSAGGPLEPWNETSLCAIHHLRGVHQGHVRVTGCAPDGLAFTLGEREAAVARA